jgi:hypothetical protein
MIDMGLVFGGATHFDYFHVVGTLENTVANVGRLQDAVPGFHDKRWTLVFVHDFDPAAVAVNHLKTDVMMMDIVRYRSALWNADVRRDQVAAKATGNQVTVLHTGTPRSPLAVRLVRRFLVALKAYANAVARQFGNARRVRRKNHIYLKSEFFGVAAQR